MPWTYLMFLIGSLSLAGIWPLAGFWSKEGILAQAQDTAPILFYLAIITVFMTAFYMFRVIFLTFCGEYRGKAHLHESPLVMLLPMGILTILAVVAGWLGVNELLGEHSPGFFEALTHPLAWASLCLAGAGIFLAYAIYGAKWLSAEALRQRFAPIYTLLSHKYWLDELYENLFLMRFMINGIFGLFHWVDGHIVDGAVNGIAAVTVMGGSLIRRLETGQLQAYGTAIFIGILAIVAFLLIFS